MHNSCHSTFVCPTEIIAFSDRIEEFRALKTEVVACSVDSKYTHLAWLNTPRAEGGLEGLKIPLLSDLTKQISKDYGVLLEDAGHTLRYGCVHSVDRLCVNAFCNCYRGLFIIDQKGILRQITMNDLPVCVCFCLCVIVILRSNIVYLRYWLKKLLSLWCYK